MSEAPESTDTHPYDALGPDQVIDAVESQGLLSDARILALNSYENRVYQVGLEDQTPVIAKFYRPGRWSREQILEEHSFTQELYDLEIPVVAPINTTGQGTLFDHKGFMVALYPRQGGHAPELENFDHLLVLGRCLGRIHRAGRAGNFHHRPKITIGSFARDSREFLLSKDFIPKDLVPAYESLTQDLIDRITDRFSQVSYQALRLHGDCHVGNLLWRNEGPHFVDFDDARMGPAVQDLWMLLSGERPQQTAQLSELLEGYCEFCHFDLAQLNLVEALRTLRIMHYSAWLARRWKDPAFPMAFPWFNTQRYWSEHILELREQMALLDEPPLQVI